MTKEEVSKLKEGQMIVVNSTFYGEKVAIFEKRNVLPMRGLYIHCGTLYAFAKIRKATEEDYLKAVNEENKHHAKVLANLKKSFALTK